MKRNKNKKNKIEFWKKSGKRHFNAGKIVAKNSSSTFFHPFVTAVPALILVNISVWLFNAGRLGLSTLDQLSYWQAIVTGLLSCIWIGTVCGLVVSLLSFGKTQLLFFEILIVSFLLSLNIPYVDFYGSLVSVSHLKYIFDFDFVKSSSSSMLDFRVIGTILLGPLMYILLVFKLPLPKKRFVSGVLAMLVFITGALSQVLKVQLNTLKIGWRTPLSLRVTPFEFLFMQIAESAVHVDMSESEKNKLFELAQTKTKQEFKIQNYASQSKEKQIKFLLENGMRGAEDAIGLQLKSIVMQRIKDKKPVVFFTTLLESLRPEESQFFFPSLERTFTPHLDTLARSGIAFTRAFTVGGVTRAGQEAVFCGLLSGEKTSAMRELPQLNPRCLTEILKKNLDSKTSIQGAWWHAGDFNFDGQGSFWLKHGTDRTLSRKNFLPQTPGTWWGLSDFALVDRMKEELLNAPISSDLQSHLFLSVSNHPDWGLPADAPDNIKNDLIQKSAHPSRLSALYTDAALGHLIEVLKEIKIPNSSESYWDAAVFIAVNDHGTMVPSGKNAQGYSWGLGGESDIRAAVAMSHAGLVLNGGLVQNALKGIQKASVVNSNFVSQADVFATLVDLAGMSANTTADSLFSLNRRWPVTVDLGSRIFLPGDRIDNSFVFNRSQFLSDQKLADENRNALNAQLFFKGYSILTRAGSVGREF